MRIAIVSDIHGNLFALEAVLEDLKQTAPDSIYHGGDLVHAGANPAAVVDRIRDLGWPGVAGNTDEMMFRPESLTDYAKGAPKLQSLWTVLEEMAAAEREMLDAAQLAWLAALPRVQLDTPMALVHASPESLWRAPMPEASDADLESVYGPLGRPVAVYAHIHRSYIRRSYVRNVAGMTVVNTGSVSMSHDGDRRASYLLLDDTTPVIRRVEYDVDKEIRALAISGIPHADWVSKILVSATPQMP